MKPIIRTLGVGLAVVILFIGFGSSALARQLGLMPKAIVGAQIATHYCQPVCGGLLVPKRFDGLVGGGLDARLWGRYSAEVDAIFKPREYQSGSALGFSNLNPRIITTTDYTEGHSWDFPVMLKVNWDASTRRTPYVLGGFVASRTTGMTTHTIADSSLGIFSSHRSESLTQTGILLGGGVAWTLRRVQLFPEGRYTEGLRDHLPGGTTAARSLEFVLGISLAGK